MALCEGLDPEWMTTSFVPSQGGRGPMTPAYGVDVRFLNRVGDYSVVDDFWETLELLASSEFQVDAFLDGKYPQCATF